MSARTGMILNRAATGARNVGFVAACCTGIVLGGCSLAPHYERPALDLPQAAVPVSTEQMHAQSEIMRHWWRHFDDPVLDQLVAATLENNLDIALQAARVREARAQLGLVRTQFYPTLGAQAGATRAMASLQTNPQLSANQRYSSTYSVAATLGYELNLFSALAERHAANARLLAAAWSQDAVRLAAIADVVASYLSLRDAQSQIAITEATIADDRDNLKLAQERFRFGAIGQLELAQQRALLASVEDRLPPLRQQADRLQSVLAILTGQTAREITDATAAIPPGQISDTRVPDVLPPLLPSTLVNRRPDVRAAESILMATGANLSVARAQYLPKLNLIGLVGSAATTLADLFGTGTEMGSIGGSIAGPILSFGRVEAGVEAAKAQQEQATIVYRQTVRQAFREVRDALRDIGATSERVDTARQAVQAHEETVRLAQARFDGGMVGFQDVLDARRQLYAAQMNYSDAMRDRRVASANLFKALGGGWDAEEGAGAQVSRELGRNP